ncbi:hypothetical protein EV174_002538 [Coemansia sp. RSA 2320]|nr:hypothetical protein EV174_002538 [Coemansia sp. RSA 2320]
MPPTRRPQRAASVLSHESEANTIVEATAGGDNLIRTIGSSAARRPVVATAQHHPRTIMILLKLFSQDRAEIEQQAQPVPLEAGSAASPHLAEGLERASSLSPLFNSNNNTPPSSCIGDMPASQASPNQYLIDWTLRTFNVNPAEDTVILANVRPSVTSAKTKWFDSSIAAFATMYDAEEREKSIKLLQRYLSDLWQRGYLCRALTLHGDKREEIAARAAEENVHNIVVGMRRRQKPSLMMGKRSFVSNLMQSSEVPVTAVRLPQ